ncbi:MAG TPA: sigma-54-dependent Fis family transcriptional regulator [Gammaproteobacteria bacterium]|nr:sigma-54-dependent Fis family transcriptional regulator [Gammaproteobacteria bacterium]
MKTPLILVVEDDAALCDALAETLRLAQYRVVSADGSARALQILAMEKVDLVISDVRMPGMSGHVLLRKIRDKHPQTIVLLMTAYGSIQQAVEAMRDGAVDYLVKPFEAQVLVNTVERYLPADVPDGEVIAEDSVTLDLLQLAKRVAQTNSTVLITGKSGTGKEVIARFIHQQSARSAGPFVAVNCAAIPENMLEATLFGYEKGAFTGAYQASPGKFEQAQGGTLLLDEISEMDLGLQAKLLRVLQEREVERLGGKKLIVLDVRVLATSNREIRQEVAAKRFREDLYYRLNVFPLHMPTLASRPGDILPLTSYFLRHHAHLAGRVGVQLSAAAQAALLAYRWPGNVRELDNLLQRALILQLGETIEVADLQFEAAPVYVESNCDEPQVQQVESTSGVVSEGDNPSLGDDLRQREAQVILDCLREVNGRRAEAAAALGISQRTLRYKLKRLREAGFAIPQTGSAG